MMNPLRFTASKALLAISFKEKKKKFWSVSHIFASYKIVLWGRDVQALNSLYQIFPILDSIYPIVFSFWMSIFMSYEKLEKEVWLTLWVSVSRHLLTVQQGIQQDCRSHPYSVWLSTGTDLVEKISLKQFIMIVLVQFKPFDSHKLQKQNQNGVMGCLQSIFAKVFLFQMENCRRKKKSLSQCLQSLPPVLCAPNNFICRSLQLCIVLYQA